MDIVILCIVVVFGLIFGSFFNVLIYRLPRGESVVTPRSHCPACGHPVKFYENIPVLSYLVLGGRCAGCKMPISPVYPAVELLSGIWAVALWMLWFKPQAQAVDLWWRYLPLALQMLSLMFLLPMFIIDMLHYIIPDILTLPWIPLGLAFSCVPHHVTPLESLLGILAGGGSLWLIGILGEWLFKKDEAMGGGDIKFMAGMGAIWGWKTALLAIFFSSLLGALIGGGLMIVRMLGADRKIPFGPFLAVGLVVAILAGDTLVVLYFDWIDRLIFSR
ncbi:MAG: prepilin peptidase [Chitinivibrionales bacterium]|nr:prepilin peptidase [Chitinivibrionales bacterium]